MKINHNIVQCLSNKAGLSLGAVLNAARVSRTAYYSLTRKDSVVPKSLLALAKTLGVPTSHLLVDEDQILADHLKVLEEVSGLVEASPDLDPNEVRHVLLLLQLSPIERLARGLRPGGTKSSGVNHE